MKRRIIALLLSFTMITALTACAGTTGSAPTAAQQEDTEAPVAEEAPVQQEAEATEEVSVDSDLEQRNIKIIFPYINATPSDTAMISEALSAITLEKYNCTVELEPIAYASYAEQFNLLMSDSNADIDLVSTLAVSSSLATSVNKGYFLPITEELEKYGQDALREAGDYLAAGTIDGDTYMVPVLHDMAAVTGIMFLKEYVDKYEIDLDSIKELSDLTPILATIKEGEGENFSPLFLNGNQYGSLFVPLLGDTFGDNMSTLNQETGEVFNPYVTDEYRELIELVRGWYEAGYINKDAATTTTLWQEAALAGTSACWPNNMKPGQSQNQSNMIGQECVGVQLGDALACTSNANYGWAVPYQAEDPERSVMVMNLLYGDEEFFNILCWGLEGEHYVRTEDGHITFPEGVDASSSGWYMNIGWAFGNQMISYLWEGNEMDLWDQTKEFNDNAQKSIAMGFVFDSSPVKNEFAACQAVLSEFVKDLETGSADIARLDEFNAKLEASGIDAVIAEKQRQIDAFLGK